MKDDEGPLGDLHVGKHEAHPVLGPPAVFEGPAAQAAGALGPELDQVGPVTRARDPHLVQPQTRRAGVGAVEGAADRGHVPGGILDLGRPAVVSAGTQRGRQGNLDLVAGDNGRCSRTGRLKGGLGVGQRLVEGQGKVVACGVDGRLEQAGWDQVGGRGRLAGGHQAQGEQRQDFHAHPDGPGAEFASGGNGPYTDGMESNPLQQKYGRVFEPGDLIFEEDDEGDHMFIIQEGQVAISRQVNGVDTRMALLEKGEFFGEMAIVNHIRRTARARAQARTQLLAFDRAGLEQLVEKNPKIALSIIDRLCRRLGSANAQVRQMAQNSTRQSLLVALQVLSQKDEGMGTLPQVQRELGMTLQCSEDEVAALVRDLVKQGALALDGERLAVADRGRLKSLAEAL